MKALSFSLFGALALSLIGCGAPVEVDEVTPVTQDLVDSMSDLPVFSRELSVEFEAAGIVAFELIDENGYANIAASILSQDASGCISAVATNATVDVTWGCTDISGASQIVVALAGSTLTFTNAADNLQIGNATVSYQNVFVVEEISLEGSLTRSATIAKGSKTFEISTDSNVGFVTDGAKLSFNSAIDVTLNGEADTQDWSSVVVARGAKAPASGEVTPGNAFSAFDGGFISEFASNEDSFFIASHNAFGGLGVQPFSFNYEIDTANNNTLSFIPLD